MRILLIGGAGFLGSALRAELVKDKKNTIQVMDTFSHGFDRNAVAKPNLEQPVVASIKNSPDISRVLERFKPEIIFHLAAYNSRPENFGNLKLCAETNYLGTANLVHALIGLDQKTRPKKLIFASTLAAAEPQSHFGISKRAAEDLLRTTFGRFPELGIEITILRFAEIYGMSSPYTSTSLVNFLVDNMLADNSICLFSVNEKLDTLHISDAVLACRKAILAPTANQIIDVGTGVGYAIREIVSAIKERISYKGQLAFQESPRFPVQSLVADTNKAEQLLGFTAQADFQTELAKLIKKRKGLRSAR